MTRWLDPQPVDATALADLRLHSLVAQTLIRRGIKTPTAAAAFLNLGSQRTFRYPNLDVALDRLELALDQGEQIGVWGDFDVDGQTATTLLVQTLQALRANVISYIPIRGREGHGIHIETLRVFFERGVTLLLTCDTGVTAFEALAYAKERNVDVIVTDHHELGEELPEATAIINPRLLPSDHPLATLAGVGVAYKLAEALIERRLAKVQTESLLQPEQLLDLVALGLVADVALLEGETRLLVQRGLQQLRHTERLGLKIIAELTNTSLDSVTEETIGFTFAPRLNAIGRLSDANPAVELLLTEDPARARVLAVQVEGLNSQRRLLTSQVYEAAEAKLREHPEALTEPAIVLSHPNWPGGVVGIVANRLVERYHKPTILLSESEDGILRGSARSVEGLHITQAIATQSDLLLNFGGHPMAAGLALPLEQLANFKRGLGRAVVAQLGQATPTEPVLQVDAWLKLEEIDLELANALEALAPFGAGNPQLVLAARNVQLKSVTTIGKAQEHVRLTVTDEAGQTQSLMWWNGASHDLPEEGSHIDVAYTLRASTFRGKRQVSLQFEDFRLVENEANLQQERILIVEDWRGQTRRLVELGTQVAVWAEGVDRDKGQSRFDLVVADELAIYSTPPSPTDLQDVIDRVKPTKIYLFGISPSPDIEAAGNKSAEVFLNHLSGLAKYAINQRQGSVTISTLAAVTGQRLNAIRLGLEWLAAAGHIRVESDGDALQLTLNGAEPNPYLKRELYLAIWGILEETTAYRAHFQRANPDSLFS